LLASLLICHIKI